MKLGLCTMSFQQNSPEEVIEICKGTNVECIEWSGREQHLPPESSAKRVQEVARICHENGFSTPSYGSYFSAFRNNPGEFDAVLDVTEGLGADTVRVWSGLWDDPGELDELQEDQVKHLIDNTAVLCEKAVARKIRFAFEYHTHTPTCGAKEVMRIIKESGHPNCHTYWQIMPEPRRTLEQNLQDIEKVWPSLAYVHCHYFEGETLLPMEKGDYFWKPVIAKLKELTYRGPLFLEYYKDYTPELFKADLSFLSGLISN